MSFPLSRAFSLTKASTGQGGPAPEPFRMHSRITQNTKTCNSAQVACIIFRESWCLWPLPKRSLWLDNRSLDFSVAQEKQDLGVSTGYPRIILHGGNESETSFCWRPKFFRNTQNVEAPAPILGTKKCHNGKRDGVSAVNHNIPFWTSACGVLRKTCTQT